MKSILDPTFRYVPSHETDIRKTFKKARDDMRKDQEKRKADEQHKVVDIKQANLRG